MRFFAASKRAIENGRGWRRKRDEFAGFQRQRRRWSKLIQFTSHVQRRRTQQMVYSLSHPDPKTAETFHNQNKNI